MAAITTSPNSTLRSSQPALGSLLQSEWTKLRSLRSTWIMVALAIGLSVGFSAVVGIVTGLTFDTWTPDTQAGFDPVLTPMSGWLFGMVLVIALGVTSVTSEYGSRMIRTSFIVTPNRTRVFAAKALVIGLLGTAVTAITFPGMFLVSQPIYAAYGLETASVTDNDAVRFLLVGSLLQGPLYTLLSISFGWILRSTASAISAAIAFFFLPWMLAPMLPLWLRENVLRYLPDNAKDSMAGLVDSSAPTYLADGPAIVVLIVWIAGALTAATFILNRRDV